MADLFDNPAGLYGFEFIEFSAPETGVLEPIFKTMGFIKVAEHRSKNVHLWRQGGINLITNYEPGSPAWFFAREHGPSACGMAFRVESLEQLTETKAHLEVMALDILWPTHHGVFMSIYFFDPNGHRIELAADIGTPEQYEELERVAQPMLDEWAQTKKAPQHANWLHDIARASHSDAP